MSYIADFLRDIEIRPQDECWIIQIASERTRIDSKAKSPTEGIVGIGFLRGFDYWDDICLGIAIHPDYRNKGYGTLMMAWLDLIARQRGVKNLRLHVHPDNLSARKLYHKFDFVLEGQRENGEFILFKKY